MIVVDGSAVVIATVDATDRGRSVRTRLRQAGPIAAPHLVDAEIGQSIRGLLLRLVLTAGEAEDARVSAERLVGMRFPHRQLGARAWELRDNVSYYDGLYVALAEQLGTQLLTADRKLANAIGPTCAIEVV